MAGVWVIAALLVPLSLNQLDKLAGKLLHLYNSWRYSR